MTINQAFVEQAVDPAILPKGDRADFPPGRGQFRMASLLALSTAVAVVAAVCHWLSIELTGLAVFESVTVMAWWKFAELRDCPAGSPKGQTKRSFALKCSDGSRSEKEILIRATKSPLLPILNEQWREACFDQVR